MRVEFEQSGGAVGWVPGRAEPVAVVAEELSSQQRRQLYRLVDAARLSELATETAAHPNVPTCRLCVEDDQGERQDVRFAETAIPPHVRPLVEWLRKHSGGRSRRR